MNKREWLILTVMVVSLAMIGTVEGGVGVVSFAGLGLLIWLIWRGRKL